jgi:hypothetical protein
MFAARNMMFAGAGLDPDAAAIIAAIEAHATVSGTQRAAIDAFFRTGKDEGWYSALKRFYLTIWADDDANAIDWITRGSGSFVGGVTHGDGYVQGNGSTGYFNTSAAPDAVGITHGNETYGVLYLDRPTIYPSSLFGVRMLAASPFDWVDLPWITSSSSRLRCRGGNTSGGSLAVSENHMAVIQSNSLSSRNLLFLKGGSIVSTVSNSNTETAAVINNPMFLMAQNNFGAALFSDAKICNHFMATAMTNTQIQDYSAAIKTLWEICTGLTLP